MHMCAYAYVLKTKQSADMFTKALSRPIFEMSRDSIPVCSIPGLIPITE
jgi:hypothetical protein